MAEPIEIVLNGERRRLDGVSPAMTLLDWLRGPARLTGTKEGCAEGDCGACTVLLETQDTPLPINACLALVGQMHGRAIRTVEGLRGADGSPHPVQRALAESDGTQCGFCTPGIVMSAVAFACGGEPAEPDLIHDALAGNLCRCTGYRPIVEAVARCAQSPEPWQTMAIGAGDTASRQFDGASILHAPRSLAELLQLRARYPDAWLLAGGTDLGVRISHDREVPQRIIHVAGVPELNLLAVHANRLEIGAATTYRQFLPTTANHSKPFAEMIRRLGSRQIRAMGTMGGNLGTASPIGDTPPVLLALGATLLLASVRGRRVVPIDDYFLGYRKTALAADEIIVAIDMPLPDADEIFHVDKVSKRRDQDISAVLGAYRLRIADGVVQSARLAFGGMAATPARATHAEAALIGAKWSEATVERAAEALADDFKPLDDWRASAGYRLAVAGNLLRRLYLRSAGVAVELDAL
ncbi:MAG: xanthine dehydrogenase small subunit [Reyranellaceae bacterium]